MKPAASIVLLLALATAACTPKADLGTSSVPQETASTSQSVSSAPSPLPTQATETTALVGLWTAIDGSLHLQFFSSGRFSQHFGGREDDPDEFWSEEGSYQLRSADELIIDVPRLGPLHFEFVHDEPWLMLRDPEGKVMRCRRNLGLMETTRVLPQTLARG